MDIKRAKRDPSGIKIFFPKIFKKFKKSPIISGAWGPRPPTLVWDTFELH